MVIYGAYAEDIDYLLNGNASVITTAGRFRSGWARCAISVPQANTAMTKTPPFSAGALTTAWLSYQMFIQNNLGTTNMFGGFGLSGTNKMLGVGSDGTTPSKLCLYKYDGTTRTQLATEGGTSLAVGNLLRFDIQVVSYGASATVNVFLNGVSLITFTGDVTVSGMTNFDSVFYGFVPNGSVTACQFSEVFVTDSDTRAVQGLNTLALTGAGTTNNWTNNTFSNINGINVSDANPAFVNTTAKDQQYTLGAATPVTYSVLAVVISARLARPAAAVPTQVKLGYGNGAGGSFGTGAAKTPSVGFSNFQQIDAINPVTGLAFTQSDIAALQLDMQSA